MMADGKRFTCYKEKDEYGDDTIVLSDEYTGCRPIYKETVEWYRKSNTYYSECTITYMSKEELEEYLKKFDK